MPALTSSLISPALEQLADFPGSHLPRGGCSGLREFLSAVPDPRDPRGVRHSLTSMLLASVAAVLAGARSLAAIGEWVADAPPGVLAALGVRYIVTAQGHAADQWWPERDPAGQHSATSTSPPHCRRHNRPARPARQQPDPRRPETELGPSGEGR